MALWICSATLLTYGSHNCFAFLFWNWHFFPFPSVFTCCVPFCVVNCLLSTCDTACHMCCSSDAQSVVSVAGGSYCVETNIVLEILLVRSLRSDWQMPYPFPPFQRFNPSFLFTCYSMYDAFSKFHISFLYSISLVVLLCHSLYTHRGVWSCEQISLHISSV